ncbi:LuxE/PaaK family acyltransferase [Pannonibacter tanglangensis]|uniref:Acyl-protein synthetase n=1 Tax=Pannonibacter tanglangensis TaxID=2750084 RepID=A0ABW9ZPM9_9HYPH|nr:acyl-protein synthetase [Pannonibacter sp. XCT-34]NBN64934.1 acyl-protein synthetase [Pannonibacter sp. XCT-34]
MSDALAQALAAAPYALPQPQREALLLDGLNALTQHHHLHCKAFARILDGAWNGAAPASSLADVPYLPVSLFKTQTLQSVPDSEIRITLTSSGTTGQSVSRIRLDAETSTLQQRALSGCLMHVLGRQRLPMLVIDTDAVFKDPTMMSARGAGVLGLMRYGRNHAFALDPQLRPDLAAVRGFLEAHGGGPFFLFGFTFMVWISFYEQFRAAGLDLSNGILLHSGGWKKMTERSVDQGTFRKALAEAFNLTRIHNFYGMVEQLGSICLEGPDGLLYPPNFSDVIIRDPETWEPAPLGRPGVVQVLSLLPRSYPGHSLLTEDLGVVEAVDAGHGGWMGKGIRILGRVARADLRGCSDVIASAA